MGLSDDQRAMLRMVAQRGEQGYEDIAALMGLSVDEVRAKVAAALAELDEEGALAAGAAASATPGKSAATEPAAPEEPARAEPEPKANEPAAEPPPATKPPLAPRSASSRSAPRISMPRGQVLWAAMAGGAIVVALIVIAIVVGSGGGDDESASAASDGTTATTTASSGATGKSGSTNPKEVTKAVLKPVDGSEAEGVVVFGRVKNSLALEIAAEGLQPTGSGERYSIWLSKSPQKMLPLAAVDAPKGRIAAQLKVPAEILGYLADETFTEIALTRTDNATLQAALKKAVREKQSTPDYTGTEVLRGQVTGPIVGAAQRLEEIEAEKKGE